MAGIDIMGGLNKAFLATVGAVAITAEKSQQAVEDLVKKGELTVQQGKSLNQELSRKAKEAAQETTDGALRAFLEALSDEDRAARIALLTEQMQQCARELEFEQAARLRDEIRKLSGLDAQGRQTARPGTIGAHRRARGRTRK